MENTTFSNKTAELDLIQEWANVRGGTPAWSVDDETNLKIIFDELDENIEDTQIISWEEFFSIFSENQYKFFYNENLEDGTLSRDYKIAKE